MIQVLIEKFGTTINIITNLFFLWTTLKTDIYIAFKNYYKKNFYFRFTYDILIHSNNLIKGYLYDYPVEPFEKNWINKIITFDSEKNGVCEMIESFDLIIDYKDELNTEELINNKLTNINFGKYISGMKKVNELYMIKYKNNYIFRMTSYKLCNHNVLSVNTLINCFMIITFENKDIEETIDILIPQNHFIEKNEILSLSYLKRYFSYQELSFPFSTNYTLNILDSNLNSFIIDSKQYILLLKDGYTVEDIK